MIISIPFWGDWHTEAFRRFGLPSLVPQMGAGDRLVLHTTEADYDKVRALCPANTIAHFDIGHLIGGTRPKGIHVAMWLRDFGAARRTGETIALLWPDVVFGPGTLDHWRDLMAGHDAVVQHFPRIVLEDSTADLEEATSNRDLATIAMRHEHPIDRAHRFHNARFPDHATLINWRFRGGILSRLLAATPTVCDASRLHVGYQSLLTKDPGERLAVVRDSDDAIGLSLAPRSHEPDWVGPSAFTVDQARRIQDTFPSPSSRTIAAQSYLCHANDITPDDWLDDDREAAAIVRAIFEPDDMVRAAE